MWKIILKSSWRQLWKHKGYSTINILGLAVGLGVALLSALWVQHELGYDKMYSDNDRIYRVMQDFRLSEGGELETSQAVPLPLATILREETPGLELVVETAWGTESSLVVGEKRLRKTGNYVHPDYLELFDLDFLQGTPASALDEPNKIVLTEQVAKDLFGDADPIGEMINLDNDVNLQVSGIIPDFSEQSSLQRDFLLPFSLYEQRVDWVTDSRNNWENNSFQIYVKTTSEADIAAVKRQLRPLFQEHSPEQERYVNFHAMADWHLKTNFENGEAVSGAITYVRLFGIIGLLVLFIACFNFVNLATAQAEQRAKEVGVRKTVGANRALLMTQFMGEAGQVVVLSAALALVLVQLSLTPFNTLMETSLEIPWQSPVFWGVVLAVLALTTLFAGSYPALYLTRFQPKEVLYKGQQSMRSNSNRWGRRGLVTLQFTISIILIAGSLIVHKQVQYAKERPLGYDQDRLLSVMITPDLFDNYDQLKRDLLNSNMVDKVTTSGSPITSVWSNMTDIGWPGKQEGEDEAFAFISTGYDYFETTRMQFVQGRAFSDQFGTDTAAIIVNQAAVERMRLEDPLSASLEWGDDPYRIIGVVEDVIMTSPYDPIRPTLFVLYPNWSSAILYRLKEGVATDEALAAIGPIFETHDTAMPFTYNFVDEAYGRKFRYTNFIGNVALIFAGLAIFLSCLGLLGLATYMAERRTKEISIRKILGASIPQLWLLLSQEFMLIIGIGAVLAIPIGGYFLSNWLDKYEYRIDLPWFIFGVAGAIALGIALATISWQSLKAAWVNPAQRLRSE